MPDATMKPITRRYDIDTIVERVQAIVPGIQIEQLRVKHDADDDGLWFFRVAGEKGDVQLESSTYDLPFVIETSTARQPQKATTIDDAVEAVKTFFGCS